MSTAPAEPESTPPSKADDERPLELAKLTQRAAWMDIAIVIVAIGLMGYVVEPVIGSLFEDPYHIVVRWLMQRAAGLVLTIALAYFLLRSESLSAHSLGIRLEDFSAQLMTAAFSVPLAYVAVGVSVGVLWGLRQLAPEAGAVATARESMGHLRSAENVTPALVLFVVAVVQEETLFRGLLLTRLRRVLGRWWPAVLITSVCFAGMHLGLGTGYALGAFLLSLVWSYVYIRSGSLLATMLGHFLFNCSQLLVLPRIIGP
jgi:membrane protease YdiL (CAAX protease family)